MDIDSSWNMDFKPQQHVSLSQEGQLKKNLPTRDCDELQASKTGSDVRRLGCMKREKGEKRQEGGWKE